jgi:iron complex transport system substrate-binding protein
MKSGLKIALTALLILATFYAALGAASAGQNSDSFSLNVFGNANMDNTIDEQDVAYLEEVIAKTKQATNLSDANLDGSIDDKDVQLVKEIIKGDEKQISVIDESGKTLTIKEPLNRIVVCHAMFAEVMKSLGADDKIVGIPTYMENYTTFYPALSKLPTVGGASTPDTEAIVSLKPDLVIVYGNWAANLEKDLSSVSPVLRLTYRPFSTTDQDIMMLGYILGKSQQARELIDFYRKPLTLINERVSSMKEDEKPRVYLEYSDYRTNSEGSGTHEMLLMAGGRNIASGINTDPNGVPFIDPEWVVEENPEIIMRRALKADASCGYDEDNTTQMKALREKILSRPELANITAVKDGQVYCFSSDISTGLSYWLGIVYMAKILHPDIFADLDPVAIHQEYLTRFQKLDFNLNEHGVFFYPMKNTSER